MSNHMHEHISHTDSDKYFMNKIAFLDSAMRKRTLPPEEILDMLPRWKSSSILDVGAGSGYLTIPAAKETTKDVFALDMDAKMLEVIRTKAKTENITNIRLLQNRIDDIPLPDSSVEIVLASLILHEVGPLAPVLASLRRVLKSGGHFLCLEYEKEESAIAGPPMHIRIPSAQMKSELEASGFTLLNHLVPGESIYILTAQKK